MFISWEFPGVAAVLPTEGAVEEVLLDQNEETKGQKFLSIGTLKVSPNSRFLAYTRTLRRTHDLSFYSFITLLLRTRISSVCCDSLLCIRSHI